MCGKRAATEGGNDIRPTGRLCLTHMVSFSFSIASSCFLSTLITSFEAVPSSLASARSSLSSAVSLSSNAPKRFGEETADEWDRSDFRRSGLDREGPLKECRNLDVGGISGEVLEGSLHVPDRFPTRDQTAINGRKFAWHFSRPLTPQPFLEACEALV